MCRPSILTSPAAAITCIHRHASKISFFFFFSFLFWPMLQRPSLPHTLGPQTPTSPLHNPHPHALAPQASQVPATASASLHISLATSIFTTCNSTTTATLSLCARSAHDTDLPHASPTVMSSQHGTQGPPWCWPATHKPRRGATSTRNARPQHHQPAMHKPCHGATPTRNARLPLPTHHNANMAHRTPPPCHSQHSTQDRDCNKWPQWWGWWSSGGDSGSGGQWDGGGSNGSDGEALHILSMQ